MASEFSEEQTFTLTYDWKILNQGGIENKSIPARNTPILEFLDLDNDNDFDLIYGQSGNGSKVYSYNWVICLKTTIIALVMAFKILKLRY